ncbi:MAG: hypothetical protein OCD01_10270 [Fibrobacterales bacterium]
MFVIRDEQLHTLGDDVFNEKIPSIADEIIARLNRISIIQSEEGNSELRDHIIADIKKGYAWGFATIHSLFHFCSYHFTLGEAWYSDSNISSILSNSKLNAREKLQSIENLLPDY